MHCEPFAEHRPQMGCSLLHLTLEAAQASHEARSFGLRSLSEDLGAEVGDLMIEADKVGVEVGLPSTIGDCHCAVCDM
jgi:uncharacterized protein YunC (DUF1805 family)